MKRCNDNDMWVSSDSAPLPLGHQTVDHIGHLVSR